MASGALSSVVTTAVQPGEEKVDKNQPWRNSSGVSFPREGRSDDSAAPAAAAMFTPRQMKVLRQPKCRRRSKLIRRAN